MIHLSNGHSFKYAVAAGALGFDGYGYWWENPFRWVGFIDPSKFTVISKTLTPNPRKGNLNMWCPWRCVRLIPGGAVNAVGLTNPGLRWWLQEIGMSGNHVKNLILSIAPENEDEAQEMGKLIKWYIPAIVGVEVNISCPNTPDGSPDVAKAVRIVQAAKENSIHPLIVKLGYTILTPDMEIIKELKPYVEGFDLINTIPWGVVFPGEGSSPLAKYGLEGGVSGEPIQKFALTALTLVKKQFPNLQILSGGGIMDLSDVGLRFGFGANAVSFGTLFLRRPWAPNRIIAEYERIN